MPDLVTIATYRTAIEAHAVKNFLEENGVPAFLADENFANLNYAIPVSAKLQVAAEDAERASELISRATQS